MISWVYIFVAESNTMYIKFSNFSWIKEPHEIHENLNPTNINTHMVLANTTYLYTCRNPYNYNDVTKLVN